MIIMPPIPLAAEAEWRREVAEKAARSDPSAYADGLSAGFVGQKRKPPRQHMPRAGSWYDGYEMGAVGASLKVAAA